MPFEVILLRKRPTTNLASEGLVTCWIINQLAVQKTKGKTLTSMSSHMIQQFASIGEATTTNLAGTGLLAMSHSDVDTNSLWTGK